MYPNHQTIFFCERGYSETSVFELDRIYHQPPMQTEKSQPEGKRIMPERRFSEFPALSVDPRDGISWYASETDV